MPAKRHTNTQRVLDELMMDQPDADFVDRQRNTIARVDEFGLTEKQASFARHVANGLTLKEAYVRSYDCENSTVASIYSSASRLMDDPKIASRVRTLLADRQERTHSNDAKRIRQHVFDRLMVESVDDESPPAARIKALELLGKIDVVSMFKEQKGEAVEANDIDSLETKLKQALSRLIDITPSKS